MTPTEAKTGWSATYHGQAMEAWDTADAQAKGGDQLGEISFLKSALHHEERAAWHAPPEGPTKAVLYRSAATIARQVSQRLAKVGLECNLDGQLRRELKVLAKDWDP